MPLCGISSDPRLQSTSQMGMISPLHPLHSHQLLYKDIYSLWNENIEVAEMLVKYNCISTQTTCVCACACVRACEDANSKLVDVDQEMCKNLSYGLIEVNLVSRTQPSDPLHLCQCLN